jgi:hypothetical protein
VPQFHVDLRGVPENSALRLEIRGRLFPLRAHDTESLRSAAAGHAALAALPHAARARFTHFAHVEDDDLPDDAVTWVRAVVPAPEGVHLHQIVRTGLHIPPAFVREHARRKLARSRRLAHAHLAYLGVENDLGDDDAAIEAFVAAGTLVDEFATATVLAMHHDDASRP